MKDILQKLKDKKVVLFGTGEVSELLTFYMPIEVSYYVDNSRGKWGQTFIDKPICSPDLLKSEEKSSIAIVVASSYYNEISKQLKEMGFIENIHYWNGFQAIQNVLTKLPNIQLRERFASMYIKADEFLLDYEENTQATISLIDSQPNEQETLRNNVLQESVASLVGDAKKILCISLGETSFENFIGADPKLQIVSNKFNKEIAEACSRQTKSANIEYCSKSYQQLLMDYGQFDLVVLIDIINYIHEYGNFLKEITKLAERALFTSVNRARSVEAMQSIRPINSSRIREWTASEFYWVLRAFYENVELYSLQNEYVPFLKKVGMYTTMSPIVAKCQWIGGRG